MKWISSLALACLTLASSLQAATIYWNPPATNPPAPVPAFYRVQSSPVGNPAFGTWTLYGETVSTNLLVTNNVYLMFRMMSVSSGGTESDPSNVATNNLAKPNPPGNAIISASIESANGPYGPWKQQTNLDLTVPIESTNQFFRSRMAIVVR